MGEFETPAIEELRIHGVAGTPPESMLGLRPAIIDPAPDGCGKPLIKSDVEIYEPPEFTHKVRGLSWSSLTSGSARTALWVLLLPYVLVNVAGWMTLPLDPNPPTLGDNRDRGRPVRWCAFLVRFAGLLVTTVFVLFTYLTLGDVIAYQRLAERSEPLWLPGAGLGATAAVVLLLFIATRVRVRVGAKRGKPWKDDVDPVGYALLHQGQDDMWNRPGIIVRLGRLHLAWGWGVLSIVGALLTLRAVHSPAIWDVIALVLAAVALLLAAALMGVLSLGNGRSNKRATLWLRWISPIVSLVSVCLASARLASIDSFREFSIYLPLVRRSGAAAAVLLFVVIAAAWGLGARVRKRTPVKSHWNQPALLLLAAAVGTGMGAGIALQVARLLGRRCHEIGSSVAGDCSLVVGVSIDWLAVGFMWALSLFLCIVGARFLRAFKKAKDAKHQRTMVAVAELTRNVSRLLAWLAALGVLGIVGVAAVTVFDALDPPDDLPQVVKIVSVALLLAVPLLMTFWFVFGIKAVWLRVLALIGLVAALVVVAVLVIEGMKFKFAGVSLPPETFLELAQFVSLTIPTGLILSRVIWGGFRNREVRRGVGILWDLGAFWPRWFHPFAPPTYSDRAVTDLTERLEDRSDQDPPLVIAPHSQGSIIAAAAVAGVDAQSTRCLALLTYGSPFSRLYAQVFPAVFSRALLKELCDRLKNADGALRWRNLFRESDPIGGPIKATPPGDPDSHSTALTRVDFDAIVDPCGRLHSSYDLECEYKQAVTELEGLLHSFIDKRDQLPSDAGWADLTAEPVGKGRIRHKVFRIGTGPGVILLHELPGLSNPCLHLGRSIAARPFSVWMPLLYGKPGQSSNLVGTLQARFCLRRELVLFSRGKASPLVQWLRELVDYVAMSTGHEKVGIIGMCMTGGLVLGTLAHGNLEAAVSSQPSLPFPWLWRLTPRSWKSNLGMSEEDLKKATAAKKPLLALRYRGDWVSPRPKFETLIERFGEDGSIAPSTDPDVEVCQRGRLTTVEVRGRKHSVLTYNANEEAVGRVFDFLETHLR